MGAYPLLAPTPCPPGHHSTPTLPTAIQKRGSFLPWTWHRAVHTVICSCWAELINSGSYKSEVLLSHISWQASVNILRREGKSQRTRNNSQNLFWVQKFLTRLLLFILLYLFRWLCHQTDWPLYKHDLNSDNHMNAAAINFTKITVMRGQKTQLQHTVPYMFKVKVNSVRENRITTSSDDVFYGKVALILKSTTPSFISFWYVPKATLAGTQSSKTLSVHHNSTSGWG